ncbi:Protein fantom, partial [Rhizophlyctis rosea]
MTGRAAGLVSADRIDPPSLLIRPDALTDEVYHLKDENLNLKKKLNEQDDKAKKLITKVQRLSEDLQRVKTNASAVGQSTPSSATSAHAHAHAHSAGPVRNAGMAAATSRRDVMEAYDMVDDLRSQMQMMSKENTQLKNKMNFFRAMHEAETRKRTAYDHIPPRINSGVQRKLYPAITVRTVRKQQPHAAEPRQPKPPPNAEEIEKLEEIITNLRKQLISNEKELQDAHSNNTRLQVAHESQQHQNDIDRLTLQRELSDTRTRYTDLRTKFDGLDEKFRVLTSAHEEAMRTINELNSELKEERRRNVDLEGRVREEEIRRGGEKDLSTIITDLRAELKTLQTENARLLHSQFALDLQADFALERSTLQSRIHTLEKDSQSWLSEKSDLLSQLASLRSQLAEKEKQLQEANGRLYQVMHELEGLREQLKIFGWRDGEIDLGEVEMAL